MCLSIKYSGKIAKHNITCYKVLLCGDNIVKTPAMRAMVPAACLAGEEPYTPEFIPSPNDLEQDIVCGVIGEGFIHTFSFRLRARLMYGFIKEQNNDYFDEQDVPMIWKCIIPKGTYYFEGHDDTGHQCYASREIIFKKRIK